MIKNLAIWHGIIANSYVKDNKQFFDKVFGRWKDLDPSARKFYSTHMYLTIDLNNDTTQRKIIRDFDNMQYLYNIDNTFQNRRKIMEKAILAFTKNKL